MKINRQTLLDNLQPAWNITRREVRDQFRDWRIIIPILALTLVFPWLMNFTARQALDFVGRFGADIVGERLIPFLLMVVGFFPISVSLVIALESFVGEKERRSIEPLLASPLQDWQLYMGKLIAVMFPPLLASYLGIGVYLLGLYRQIGWQPEPMLLTQILLLTFVQALVMVSGAVVISTQATSVRAANLLASFIIIPMAFLIQGESMVMFWAQYNVLWWAVLGLGILALVMIRAGVSHFNREEMLGKELDTLNVRGGLATFVRAFRGDARSVGEWYRLEIGPSLRRLRIPALLVCGIVVAALLVGAGLAKDFPLPIPAIDLAKLEIDSNSSLGTITLLKAGSVPAITFQNLRASVLAMLFGMISFGVFGLLVIMLPFILIGYFAASFSSAGITPLAFYGGLVLPHGILEIPALILVGAGILYLGARLITPSEGKSLGEVLITSLAEWVRVLLAVVLPLLLLAAFLETFLTPRVAIWVLG